ncbi:hypothetical protein CFBP498_02150 [Xanthomonas hortorum pv. vitians]|uniref:Uncharacterized protein n=1 Tax=Xanthomonas hortorum pv. vitians TaxID=83224 RepID=A0A6V7BDH7_9XANT|nr:hypothetical protein CFBP498_02150 [Xanthomonas hortorum pv. vitians]CAD0300346.1 hypothetical protein CFBP498_02150 [Xanthomonas hortorum pv. vitians]
MSFELRRSRPGTRASLGARHTARHRACTSHGPVPPAPGLLYLRSPSTGRHVPAKAREVTRPAGLHVTETGTLRARPLPAELKPGCGAVVPWSASPARGSQGCCSLAIVGRSGIAAWDGRAENLSKFEFAAQIAVCRGKALLYIRPAPFVRLNNQAGIPQGKEMLPDALITLDGGSDLGIVELVFQHRPNVFFRECKDGAACHRPTDAPPPAVARPPAASTQSHVRCGDRCRSRRSARRWPAPVPAADAGARLRCSSCEN